MRDDVLANFDFLAPHYYWLECLLAGRALQRCRTAFIDETRSSRSALILGEGNGRFLCEFLKSNHQAVVVCVDASAAMLDLAKQRMVRHGLTAERVRLVQADVLSLCKRELVPANFDLIVTHFFLDCFPREQLSSLISRIAALASPDALWLLADFRVPAAGFRRARARFILRLAYAFFRVVTRLPADRLTPPDDFLKANGFQLAARRLYSAGLLHSDLWRRT
jgi:SAM-dependent methyltransferase